MLSWAHCVWHKAAPIEVFRPGGGERFAYHPSLLLQKGTRLSKLRVGDLQEQAYQMAGWCAAKGHGGAVAAARRGGGKRRRSSRAITLPFLQGHALSAAEEQHRREHQFGGKYESDLQKRYRDPNDPISYCNPDNPLFAGFGGKHCS